MAVGDIIHVLDRRLEVIENRPDALVCQYYHKGLGPYQVALPHANVERRMYENEDIGARESWWLWHPDITGEYREF